MTQSVTSWLSERGWQRYADAFVAADIDLEILPELTDGDLEKLGVTLGDRMRSACADVQRLIDRFVGPDADCADVRLARAAIATGMSEAARS
jgi:hypothetical protein